MAGSEERLAERAELRSGGHPPCGEALGCAYSHLEARDGSGWLEEPEHPLLSLCARSEGSLAERAELRSGEHQSFGEALGCAYSHSETPDGGSQLQRAERSPP